LSTIKHAYLMVALAAGMGLASSRLAAADEFYDLCTTGGGGQSEIVQGCTCTSQRLTDPTERATVIAYLRAFTGLQNGKANSDDPALKNGGEGLFLKYVMQCMKK
jgi:hypothetical protein